MIEQEIQSQPTVNKTTSFITLEVSQIPLEYYQIIENSLLEYQNNENDRLSKQTLNSISQLNENYQYPIVQFNNLNLQQQPRRLMNKFLADITNIPELVRQLELTCQNKQIFEISDKSTESNIESDKPLDFNEKKQSSKNRNLVKQDTEEEKEQVGRLGPKKWMVEAFDHLRAQSLLGFSRQRMVKLFSRNERLIYSKVQKLQNNLIEVFAIIKQGLNNMNPGELLQFDNVKMFKKVTQYFSGILEFKESLPKILSEKIYDEGSEEKLMKFIPLFIRSQEFTNLDLIIMLNKGISPELCEGILHCIWEEIKAHFREQSDIEQRVMRKLIKKGVDPSYKNIRFLADIQKNNSNFKKRDLKQHIKSQRSRRQSRISSSMSDIQLDEYKTSRRRSRRQSKLFQTQINMVNYGMVNQDNEESKHYMEGVRFQITKEEGDSSVTFKEKMRMCKNQRDSIFLSPKKIQFIENFPQLDNMTNNFSSSDDESSFVGSIQSRTCKSQESPSHNPFEIDIDCFIRKDSYEPIDQEDEDSNICHQGYNSQAQNSNE